MFSILVQTCLGAHESGSSTSRKRLTVIDLFKSLRLVTHMFDASANPKSLAKKQAMSPSSTVDGGQHQIKYVALGIGVGVACGICGCRNHG